MNINIRNATDHPAIAQVATSNPLLVADQIMAISGPIRAIAGMDEADAATMAANVFTLTRGVSGMVAALNQIAGQAAQSSHPCFLVYAPGDEMLLVSDNTPLSFGSFFTPSFYQDLSGAQRVTMVIQSAYGAVRIGVNAISGGDFCVTRTGVRHGLEPNGDGMLYRWGGGGYYTGHDTSWAPTLAVHQGKLHLFYRETDGWTLSHLISDNGLLWSAASPLNISIAASGGFGAVSYSNDSQLHVFFRDPHGNGIFDAMSTDGLQFQNIGYIGLDGDDNPNALEFQGNLCLVVRDAGGSGVMFARYVPGTGWQRGYTGFTTTASPCLVAFRGQLHLFFRDGAGTGILHVLSNDGYSWSAAPVFYTGYTCKSGPRAVVYKDKLNVLFCDGKGSGVLCISADDGLNFAPEPDWYIGTNTRTDFAAACLNDHVCVAVMDANGNGVLTLVPDLRPL